MIEETPQQMIRRVIRVAKLLAKKPNNTDVTVNKPDANHDEIPQKQKSR